MKYLILIIGLMFFSMPSYGLCLSNCDNGISLTDNSSRSNNNGSSAKKSRGYTNDLTDREAKFNFMVSGLSLMMPDQPATRDQILPTFIEYGLFYNFSDRLHLFTKWVQFDVEASNGVSWHHDHKLVGMGLRDFVGENKDQQWQINLSSGGAGWSTVTGSGDIGNVKNLDSPVFIEGKWMWVFGNNLMIGPQITFARVPNTCEDPNGTYIQCGSGGYSSVAVTIHIGVPKSWGN